jgi:hypothetical protein
MPGHGPLGAGDSVRLAEAPERRDHRFKKLAKTCAKATKSAQIPNFSLDFVRPDWYSLS